MQEVVIITNIPAPYRVDLFHYIQKISSNYHFTIIYTSDNEDNRKWTVDYKKINDSIFLQAKILKIKKRYDYKYIHFPSKLGKELSKINPDIVIAFEYNPAALLSLNWSKKNNKKFVHLTDGTINSEKNINYIQKLCRKYIIKHADAFLASSTLSKEKIISYGADSSKIFVSLLTVDINKYSFKREMLEPKEILYVGSLIQRKGLDLLFDALRHVHHPFHLSVIGDGIELDNLKKIVNTYNMSDSVTFYGFMEGKELQEKYKKSRFFVLPTREDCYGLVLLEAMCSSLPIICSKNADGAIDLIKHGFSGYIVDPNNSIKMAAYIDELLINTELVKTMSRESYEYSKEFSFDGVSKAYFEALDYVYYR